MATTTTTNTSSGIGGGGGGNVTTRQRLVHQTSGLNSANCCICSKFVPQAFNPNKCQQCFNLKDIHSAEALAEFSKSNRKICKYGYLFIAPPDLEINKTKRWQWRFFIFYDDGELTYSLDENPLTIPQGRVNILNCEKIIELINDLATVSYPYTLCLKFSPPNKDIYIAAGNYEEFIKWRDVMLSNFGQLQHHHPGTKCPQMKLSNYQKSDDDKKPTPPEHQQQQQQQSQVQNQSINQQQQQQTKMVKNKLGEYEDIIHNIDDDEDEEEEDDVDDHDDEDDEDDEDEEEDDEVTDDEHAHVHSHHHSQRHRDVHQLHHNQHNREEDDEEVDDDDDDDDNNTHDTQELIDNNNIVDMDDDDDLDDVVPNMHGGSDLPGDNLMDRYHPHSHAHHHLHHHHRHPLQQQQQCESDIEEVYDRNSKEIKRRTNRTNAATRRSKSQQEKPNCANSKRKETKARKLDKMMSTSSTTGSSSPPAGNDSAPKSVSQNQENINSSSSSSSSSNTDNMSSARRLSYKEDDLLRKQRLKENLNQLLIEYKHEEEAHLKKYSKFSASNLQQQANQPNTNARLLTSGNRTSLDSATTANPYATGKSTTLNKSSAFSLVVPSTTTTANANSSNGNSAFRPVTSLTNLLSNTNNTMPIQIQPQQQQQQVSGTTAGKLNKAQSSSVVNSSTSTVTTGKTTNIGSGAPAGGGSPSSSTSSTSWSSNCSSSSSPPKARAAQDTPLPASSDQYKKPCLISPRKQLQQQQSDEPNNGNNNINSNNNNILSSPMSSSVSSTSSSSSTGNGASSMPKNKSLTIVVRNDLQNMQQNTSSEQQQQTQQQLHSSSSSLVASGAGTAKSTRHHHHHYHHYNRKQLSPPIKQSAKSVDSIMDARRESANNTTANLAGYLWKLKDTQSSSSDAEPYEKLWFSLNSNLCSLIYWNDKHEQDIGKYPLGKFELFKCCQVVKDLSTTSAASCLSSTTTSTGNQQSKLISTTTFDYLDFRLCFHQSSVNSITLRSSSLDNKISWCESLKYLIENLAAVCTKCKPKLVVNPMPLATASSTVTSVPATPILLTTTGTNSTESENSQLGNRLKKSLSAQKSCPSNIGTQSSTLSTSCASSSLSSGSSSGASSANLASKSQLKMDDYELLKLQYDKLLKENGEITSKFKLLEQIHVDTINEYDKQQNRLYNQLDDMHVRLSKTDQEVELLNKKLAQSKLSNEANLIEIKSLNDQLNKYKEELEKSTNQTTLSGADNGASHMWNKEVKSLDARINDVLGKIKERELNLTGQQTTLQAPSSASSANDELTYKLKLQLQDAQAKIGQLTSQLNSQRQVTTTSKVTIQDLSDDLAKVLMSKEEVITQLEKQLKEKEKQIQELSEQLSEEMTQVNKYQDAFNNEVSRNTELKHLNENLNEHYTDELYLIKDELCKAKSEIDSLQQTLKTFADEKAKCELELKNLQDYSKNELETLQEEIKTLEYKLVHSQRQAQEYQTLLEDMDTTNTQLITQLGQLFQSLGGSLQQIGLNSLNELNSANIQTRLKRNQSFVQQLVQQLLQTKNTQIDDLKVNLNELKSELNQVKEENFDLNDHIYSIDVYMREKEMQNEMLLKDKEELVRELEKLRSIGSVDQSIKCDVGENSSSSTPSSSSFTDYKQFLATLNKNLLANTRSIRDFVRFLAGLNSYLFTLNSLKEMDENRLHGLTNDTTTQSTNYELVDFKKSLLGLINYTSCVRGLLKHLNSIELKQFNNQIVTYMAEQLIHKAALNGYFKFTCDLLANKKQQQQQKQNVQTTMTTTTGAGSSVTLSSSSSSSSSTMPGLTTEQEEKIFKLASELLLSDEDSLKNLSSQVLNEAKHLTQLNCVLSTLNKIRLKYLKNATRVNGSTASSSFESSIEIDELSIDLDNNSNNNSSSNTSDTLNHSNDSLENSNLNESNNINYILEVIREIFVQHKVQISEQLNEVHKLMSISSDDDLIAHLQTQNSNLQQELAKLKEQASQKSEKKWLTTTSNNSQLRRFGLLSSTGNSINTSSLTSTTSGTNQSSTFTTTSNQNNNSNDKNQKTFELPSSKQPQHHILTDLLSQNDTMC